MATTDLHFIADALHPVKKGVRFLGGNVDDQIQVDAAAVAGTSAAYTHGTISAWVMMPDVTGTYAIFGVGDASVDDNMTLQILAGKLSMQVTDGASVDFLVTSTDVVIRPHTWHHVAVVQNGTRPTLYVDGKAVDMTDTTSTDLTSWWDQMTTLDSGSIGAAEEGGAGALTNEFKGYIHKVKHWGATDSTGALSAAEVLADFEGASRTTALVNSWDLEFDLLDDGTGADDGTFVGDLIFSDANPFASRLSFLETVPLAADNVTIMANDGVGFAYSILGA